MIDPTLFNANHIITPHHQELEIVLNKLDATNPVRALEKLIATGAVILSKGEVDHVLQQQNDIAVTGGNAGMTKGGTGDVLQT